MVSDVLDRLAGWAQPSRAKAAAALLVISTFVPAQHGAPVAQAKAFSEPETFVQAQAGRPLLINGKAAYNPATDVRRTRQAQFHAATQVRANAGSTQLGLPGVAPYNPATDVRRARQA